jgi:hypothetical protein
MKAVLTRDKRGRSGTISKRLDLVCLGLMGLVVISGNALAASPSFFSVDTEAQLNRNEAAMWMAPSSCSETCFHGSIHQTSGTIPAISAQGRFGNFPAGPQTTVRLAQNVNELQPVAANREESSESESVSEAKSLGTEPENVGLQFLRTQTVLLNRHQWQFDAGLSYTIAESDFPVQVGSPITGVTEGRIRQRLLLVPFEARYGLTSRVQLFASAPVGYSNTETTFGGVDDYFDTGGIGDVSFGLSAQLIPGTACRSELVGTFGVTAPTGDASLATGLLAPEASLGEGYWGFTGNLLWVRNYDPVVLFYGVGANFRLEEDFGNIHVDPGERFLYQFGVGFAVNRHVTLSGAFIGAYWVEDQWNGLRIAGGSREPLRFRIAATIGKSCRIVEPFAEIGMTEEAPDSRIGITWTF